MAAWQWLETLGVQILARFGLSLTTATQLIRFVLVGFVAGIVYLAIMAVVIDGFGAPVLLGAFLAFVIGTAMSFVGNALWSFGSRPTGGKAVWFFVINTIGLCLNMLIAWALERMNVHYLMIGLTVLIVVPMFNFVGHRLITFGRDR
jgi:putative flippase GtrA